MEYFGPDAFSPRRRKWMLVAALAAIAVIVAAALAAFAAGDPAATAASAPSPVSVHDLAPPGTDKEPLDGGSPPAVIPNSDGGPSLSGTVAAPGEDGAAEDSPPDPAADSPSPSAAQDQQGHSQPSADGWTRPVGGYVITAPYGQPGSWAAGHHTGVDLAVPVGTEVVAVHPGTVVSATYDKSYGNVVLVQQNDGLFALYAHLSKITVSSGQQIRTGFEIGLSGATGRVTGPHLHFEMRTGPRYGSDIDPVAYLRSHGVVL
ncbi:M23 family metallopeptidase [Streptomyces sp. NPDC013157]|uniref:M23 family metallopeptidase n=1 Tax=Streptomyces sp. NPDC013157 TaxID=3364861 RepID=UPI0036B4CF9C